MRAAWCVGAGILTAVHAAQALTPTSQERRVAVVADFIAPSFQLHFEDIESAPDFGPFAAVVSEIPRDASAAQDSWIDPDALHATGSFATSAGVGGIGSLIDTDAESVFAVSFDVAVDSPFSLTGLLELELQGCDGSTQGWIRLAGPGGVVAEVDEIFFDYGIPFHCLEGCQASLPVSASGVLTPGSYTLMMGAVGNTRESLGPSDICDSADVTGSYAADLVLSPPQVPALPGAVPLALAAALALSAKLRRGQAGFAASASIARQTSSSTRKAEAATGQPA